MTTVFWSVFAWYIIVSFNFQILSLYWKHIGFLLQYNNLCLWIEVFSPFTYNITTDILGFKSNILLFDFYVFHLFYILFSLLFLRFLGFIEYFPYFIPFLPIILVVILSFTGCSRDYTCFLDLSTSNIN